jgi:hypothetical protein
MRVGKKALLPGQVLIFILAGLIFVLILGFGYKAVNDLLKSAEDINLAELKSEFEASVESAKGSFESVRRIDLRVPKSIYEICFFDFDNCESLVDVVSETGVMLDWAVSACSFGSSNVFSVPRLWELSVNDLRIDSSLEENFLCVKAERNIVTFKIKGKGNFVEIGKWFFVE